MRRASSLRPMRRWAIFQATYRALINGDLPQRSRSTRQTILNKIQERLISWNPPAWVLG